MKQNIKKKLCLISSSGGHYEQLKRLKPLEEKFDIFYVTEKTRYREKSDCFLLQTGLKDKYCLPKMIVNVFKTIRIWCVYKPDAVVTTGSMVAIPMVLMAKLMRRKTVYIESYARVKDLSKTGKLMYKFADLFIVQWKELQRKYPNSLYGGSIY